MIGFWERNVPVFDVPVRTRALYVLTGLFLLAFGLVTYRELAGLGPVSGMNDAYAWGIWKTFNVMTLTGLGSGAFSVGMTAYLFGRWRLHSVMRTACLTSLLAYISGMTLLAVDVGRPWNMYLVLMPWKWNYHSPLLEVAVCMPLYAMFPLFLENIPPVLEWLHEARPSARPIVEKATAIMAKFYPLVVGLAYILPAMHQSSLGALMLLAGDRVHPLWQTPFLPLLYVWAAAFMGFSCVAGTLLFCTLMWKRPMDLDVLREMGRITCYIIIAWLVFRFSDILFSGKLGLTFQFNQYAVLFWIEMVILTLAAITLWDSAKLKNARMMFHAHLIAAIGGMMYRFDPTTLAFNPKSGAIYFPTAMEILVALGFVSFAIAVFMIAAKKLAIIPAPLSYWYDYENEVLAKAPEPQLSRPGEALATAQD
ncbi:MAG: NrfD/PsrC family molybdoenzyme membrane anchor subunit [Acidobacteriaceae bacterium]